jgi:hypothetical protein
MYFSAEEIENIIGIKHRLKPEWLSYIDAEKVVRSWGVKSQTEYLKLPLEKRQVIGLPSNPEKRYKGNGWKGWPNFFGQPDLRYASIPYASFEKAKGIMRMLGLKSSYIYKKLKPYDMKKFNLPGTPYRYYKDKGWKGWDDFLGKNKS